MSFGIKLKGILHKELKECQQRKEKEKAFYDKIFKEELAKQRVLQAGVKKQALRVKAMKDAKFRAKGMEGF